MTQDEWLAYFAAQRCDLSDLPTSQCACRIHRSPSGSGPESKSDNYGPWFEARWSVRCADCAKRYYRGDKICSDGAGGYLCEPCGEQ